MEHVVEAPHAGSCARSASRSASRSPRARCCSTWRTASRVSRHDARAHRRGRAARRSAERARADPDRRRKCATSICCLRLALPWIEVTSFVHPKAVPQMADADAGVRRHRRTAGRALHRAGAQSPRLDRAIAAAYRTSPCSSPRPRASAAPTSIAHRPSLADARAVIDGARHRGHPRARVHLRRVRLSVRGRRRAEAVRGWPRACSRLGADEVVLGDTIGVATPGDMPGVDRAACSSSRQSSTGGCTSTTRAGPRWPNVHGQPGVGHHHFDSSAGGLGGCPFAGPSAAAMSPPKTWCICSTAWVSNTASPWMVLDASRFIVDAVGHPLTSKVYQAGPGGFIQSLPRADFQVGLVQTQRARDAIAVV